MSTNNRRVLTVGTDGLRPDLVDPELMPCLGELLDAHDARVAVAATSSPGAGILWSRKHPCRMVNTNTAYDRADLYSLGEPPAGLDHRLERQHYAARAVTDIFLDDTESRLCAPTVVRSVTLQHGLIVLIHIMPAQQHERSAWQIEH